MDPERAGDGAKDRRVAWAAAVTALLGVNALLLAIFAHLKVELQIGIPVAVLYFGLAYGIRRGSRAAAAVAVAAFALQAATNLVVYGFAGVRVLWMVLLGATLWIGMRGVFAQAARPSRPGPR